MSFESLDPHAPLLKEMELESGSLDPRKESDLKGLQVNRLYS